MVRHFIKICAIQRQAADALHGFIIIYLAAAACKPGSEYSIAIVMQAHWIFNVQRLGFRPLPALHAELVLVGVQWPQSIRQGHQRVHYGPPDTLPLDSGLSPGSRKPVCRRMLLRTRDASIPDSFRPRPSITDPCSARHTYFLDYR